MRNGVQQKAVRGSYDAFGEGDLKAANTAPTLIAEAASVGSRRGESGLGPCKSPREYARATYEVQAIFPGIS